MAGFGPSAFRDDGPEHAARNDLTILKVLARYMSHEPGAFKMKRWGCGRWGHQAPPGNCRKNQLMEF
jgi:hypothetical protein